MLTRACLVLGVALLAACNDSGSRERGGELTAEWLGSDTGGISARPHAVWCKGDNRIKITAVRGDVGLGLLIYPNRKLLGTEIPVFDPGIDSAVRPGVAFAGRWVRSKQVVAFQSDSGSLQFDSSETGLSGKFTVRLKGLNSSDTLRMSGHFGRVNLEPCLNDTTPPAGPG